MISALTRRVFGSKNDRDVKNMRKTVQTINEFESSLSQLSDDQLKAKTVEFKQRLQGKATLDQILPEAFAVVREAAKRVLNMRHFDVQLIGGMVLHQGKIAEMRTGEGKTLVATLPAYLNALTERGVHIVTVNDYLAKRDADWMRPIYEFLGLSVGVILSQQDPSEKQQAYAADITYGTNNEFGFDYLRDNMAFMLEQKVQRDLHFAIVDEVDSILIDEARTPLIISGAVEDSSKMYLAINKLMPKLINVKEEPNPYFTIDEKNRAVELTEDGHQYIEELLAEAKLLDENDSLYAATNLGLLHHVNAALKAHALFQRDVEYIVQNNEIVIVDEHTGRTMPGRRWSEGIHQAIEAKEGVKIQNESQTLASTTFQNYFRLYDKLAGMTGTADTEAYEFHEIYGLDVVVIPTNKPMIRKDLNDLIYLSAEEKFTAIIDAIREAVAKGQPVLVGTISIEVSELVSKLLQKEKIKHNVLNAKFHEQEADIVAQAGRPGAVTIATNMAGRGTDIVLGGNWEAEIAKLENPTDDKIAEIKSRWQQDHEKVLQAGGLCILATERHESRRIDNQLRGRSGRQGDPGVTRFYLSLEDNLMRIFASDRMRSMMQAIGMDKGEAIEHRMVTGAIEKAQRKVEGHNFDIRKQLLEYDNVANDQRTVIYQQRRELMEAGDIGDTITDMRETVVNEVINDFVPPQSIEEQWNIAGLEEFLALEFNVKLPLQQWLDEDDTLHEESLRKRIFEEVIKHYKAKEEILGPERMRVFEKQIMLQILDNLWKEHLATMDHLRQGIHLRGYAQKNPKQEYKREAFHLFQELLSNIQHTVIKVLSRLEIKQDDVEALKQQQQKAAEKDMKLQHESASALDDSSQQEQNEAVAKAPYVRGEKKVGRNEPCPCGSGKKYKQCHGQAS